MAVSWEVCEGCVLQLRLLQWDGRVLLTSLAGPVVWRGVTTPGQASWGAGGIMAIPVPAEAASAAGFAAARGG